jgi:integrase
LALLTTCSNLMARAPLDYAQAQAKAREWLASLSEKSEIGPYTVDQCLDHYVAEYKRRGGKALSRVVGSISAFIRPRLGKYEVDSLIATIIRHWQTEIATAPPRLRTRSGQQQKVRAISPDDPDAVRRRRASANRILNILKAALNLAYREGRVKADDEWRRVKPFREADAPKIRYLSHAEAQRLVNASEPGFRPLIQCALLTGCRYGEIVGFRVSDFDHRAGTVSVRSTKTGGTRHVVLTDDGVTLFENHIAGKSGGGALVFTRLDGERWGPTHQHRRLREACANAGIDPPASFHVLRHTYATHLLQAGAPLPVIAANLGHADTRMTERHYAHLVPGHVAQVIRATMPKLGLVEPSYPLRHHGLSRT